MTAADWEILQELFHQTAAQPSELQTQYLAEVCPDNPALAAQVLALLAQDADSSSPIHREMHCFLEPLIGCDANSQDIPQRFGPYRIVRMLGQGGMGTVWLAEREDLDNQVAIKFLRDAWMSPHRRRRFESEKKILAGLNHRSIARLYDASTLDDGTPWFVMEYVDGLSLTEYCAKNSCSLEQRLRLFRAVVEAVQYAHTRLIVHRDLKPSNILVKVDGTVRLLDFGIAKRMDFDDTENTRTGLHLMTPGYAAPEQLRGEDAGVLSDVYALGVILYELLAGSLPYSLTGKTPVQAQKLILEQEPPQASTASRRAASPLPASAAEWADLDVLCSRAMEKDMDRRYRSAEAMGRDVDHFLSGEPLEARPDSRRYRFGKFVRRNRVPLSIAAALFVLIAGLSSYFTWRLTEARNLALGSEARMQRVQQFTLNLFSGGDQEAGPGKNLRVVDLVDRGTRGARSLTRDPELQAELYQTLGTVYEKLGNAERADSLLRLAVDERRRSQASNHSAMSKSLVALGLLKVNRAKLAEAEILIQDGLREASLAVPADSRAASNATFARGKLLQARGAYQDSIPVLERAVALNSRSSQQTTELAASLHELAGTHFYMGHYDLADSLNRRAMDIHAQIYGKQHPTVADDLIDLGSSAHNRGKYTEAEALFRQALAIHIDWYGKDHPEVAFDQMSIAQALTQRKKFREAAELLRDALRNQENAYGLTHPRVALVLNALGSVALGEERLDEAETDFKRAVAIYRKALGDASYQVAIAMDNLATVYFRRKDYPQAEAMFRDVVARQTRALSADHMTTGISQIKLGRVLVREGRYAEAEPHLLEGYRILKAKATPSVSWLDSARKDLVEVYRSTHQLAKAGPYELELAKLDKAKP